MFAAEAERARHDGEPAYVLAGEGWHPGVIGIVASRVVERHHRPTLMIALDGEGGGRGSGRSVPAYDLHAGLAACSEHLRRFGGHRAAAGFDIDAGHVEALRRAFVHHAAASLTPDDLIPEERIDALVPGTALGLELAEELRRLEPFGMGNPEPTLLVPAARVGDARSMGDEGQHARFTLSSGGTSARGVAFRTGVRSLADCGDGPRDVALKLELNRWNGAVEARVLLRALCVPAIGECAVVGEPESFGAVLEGGGRRAEAVAVEPCRELRDRRGEGFAGVAADLLSSGESVLVVCADVARRKRALDTVLGGHGATITSWAALAAQPALAEPFEHLVALDPPPNSAGEALLLAAPAGGFAHHAWDEPEVAFALALAQAELDLRPPLTELYRGIRESGSASGGQLEALLRGSGRYPRSPALCARLIAALVELGLASYEQRTLRLIDGGRAKLESSTTYAECQQLLAASRRYLATAMPAARQAA
jgi:single-stranded-DNA-specific exonuclease